MLSTWGLAKASNNLQNGSSAHNVWATQQEPKDLGKVNEAFQSEVGDDQESATDVYQSMEEEEEEEEAVENADGATESGWG